MRENSLSPRAISSTGGVKTFDLIIFDCDGVLVDSEAIGNEVLAGILSGHGISLSAEDAMGRFVGLSVGEIRAKVEKYFGVLLPEDWTVEYYAKVITALAARVQPIDGVRQVLKRLQGTAVPFCVASQGPVSKTKASLIAAGLWEEFRDRAFSAKSVTRPKPAPDLFLHAAQSCGVPPERCAVVEDSLPGVVAGIAAGMTVFAYCPSDGATVMRKHGAITFQAMAELPQLLHAG